MERVGGEELACAIETARQAGRLLRDLFERAHTVRTKSSPSDLVTEADTASEALIVKSLRGCFPQHRILAEEGLGDLVSLGQQTSHAERSVTCRPCAEEALRCAQGGRDAGGPGSQAHPESVLPPGGLWIVDPLDGTVNYAHRYPTWGVSISLVIGGRVEVAVTHDPMRGDTYWAERGRGAWCDGRRLHVSTVAHLGEALLMTGFPNNREAGTDNNLAEFNAVMPRVHGVRRAGAAVLDLAHVADGRLEGYWEKHLRPWDWAAGWLLVEEAGGTVTDLGGHPWSLERGGLVATNGLLHAELLDALQAARRPVA